MSFGWYDPERLPDDYLAVDRAIMEDWREAWIRVESDEDEWKKLTGQL